MSTASAPLSRRAPGIGWLIAAAVSSALFLLITVVVIVSGGIDVFDSALYRAAVAVRSPTATTVATTLTTFGSFAAVVATALVAAALLRWLTHRWSSSVLLLTAVAVTAGVVYLLKIAVGRARPATDTLLGAPSLDYAFPSGHTTNGSVTIVLSAILVAITLRRPVARRLVMFGGCILAIGIGLSRIYLGYHWATDVIGGWLLATSVICAAAYGALTLSRSAISKAAVLEIPAGHGGHLAAARPPHRR